MVRPDAVPLSPAALTSGMAVRYYAAYPDEVDEWIRRNVEEADAAGPGSPVSYSSKL